MDGPKGVGPGHQTTSARQSIKYVTIFLAIFDPLPPVTLCHTPRDPPRKYVTHLGPPPFLVGLVQKTRTKTSVEILSQLFAGFFQEVLVWKVLSGVVFVCSPSVRILLLQQKVKHHFKFQISYV